MSFKNGALMLTLAKSKKECVESVDTLTMIVASGGTSLKSSGVGGAASGCRFKIAIDPGN